MAAKLKIKAGPIEFEYEGDSQFTMSDIKELFSHVEGLFSASPINSTSDGAAFGTDLKEVKGLSPKVGSTIHVNTIAAKLSVKAGGDLVIAAAAALHFCDQKDVFTRSEILEKMKSATKYYKKTYSSNLTKYIENIVGKKLNQVSDNSYSLAANEFEKLEAIFASE